ncbi:hypothetical protein [Microbispora sp. NBRC 16548]|uniref:hypothetical protein n=1 Tax=Microbispora sp. NBRC 16548 TaxID=3030994 RepID=UPI0024A20525|nr:hypothetical protein [Microbispora sp. NBRC 16548]GLX06795.1 hypothetical protein Misp03_37220 [Microbispora sp. NBRC 16548]
MTTSSIPPDVVREAALMGVRDLRVLPAANERHSEGLDPDVRVLTGVTSDGVQQLIEVRRDDFGSLSLLLYDLNGFKCDDDGGAGLSSLRSSLAGTAAMGMASELDVAALTELCLAALPLYRAQAEAAVWLEDEKEREREIVATVDDLIDAEMEALRHRLMVLSHIRALHIEQVVNTAASDERVGAQKRAAEILQMSPSTLSRLLSEDRARRSKWMRNSEPAADGGGSAGHKDS